MTQNKLENSGDEIQTRGQINCAPWGIDTEKAIGMT